MKYVDGFIIPLKKSKVNAYKKMATVGRKVWMEHGALEYFECIGAKLNQEWGGIPFAKLCKLKKDETVVFAFVVYKSKAHRDSVNKKVHADPRMNMENYKMPFSMERFTAGEFKAIVHT